MKKYLLLYFFYLLMSPVVWGQKVTLNKIMQNLEKSFIKLNKGIIAEDYAMITKAASEIVNHPRPKAQLSTIVGTLGFSMFKFKSLYGQVNDPAEKIIRQAKNKEIINIAHNQQKILNSCVACHSQFKQQVHQALKKAPE